MTDALVVTSLPEGFDDWPGLLKLIRDAFAFTDGMIDPPSSARALDVAGLQAKARQESVFLAWLDGRLAGCIFCAARPESLYIGKLAVDPALQGRGIGRALMDAAVALAAQSGKVELELQVRVELTGNQKAFARMGFAEVGRTSHAGFARPTSITMQRRLS